MIKKAKAKMFLADQRGLSETQGSRSRYTFNFGNYYDEHKQPFGDLYVVNDEVLEAGHSINICTEAFSYVMLLPVMGAVIFKDFSGNDGMIAAGQIQLLTAGKGEKINVSNPFREGLVSFLQIWIRADKKEVVKNHDLLTYDINERLNSLLEIAPLKPGDSSLPFSIYIGKFDGRGETTHQLKSKQSGLFMLSIEGAFEVQGTLLHAGDGLALWQTGEVEMEALSNEAIILAIEL